MNQEMIDFLKDLADVLEKHSGGLIYTCADNGIYCTLNEEYDKRICIGFPMNGNVGEIRRIISRHEGGGTN